jgi:hypothetical protein
MCTERSFAGGDGEGMACMLVAGKESGAKGVVWDLDLEDEQEFCRHFVIVLETIEIDLEQWWLLLRQDMLFTWATFT